MALQGRASLDGQEAARADFYGLIAHLLLAAPDDRFVSVLAAADALPSDVPGQALDRAWERLVTAAGLVDAARIREEFDALFVGTATPKVNPYASLYLAGALHEKPLAALRADLAALGIRRASGCVETEDHVSGVCEAMRVLIERGDALAVQRRFFERHLAPWYRACLGDIRNAEGASFYANVAQLAEAFLDVEREALCLFEPAADAAGQEEIES